MARNQVQFQKGMSLAGFFTRYGTEEQYRKALFQWRWPDGFVCPACGQHRYDALHTRKLYQCRACHHQTSPTAGTIFQSTRLPLTTWFLGMYLVTQSKTGVSALALRRYLGITYNAAWRMKHKLMQVMKERDDSQPLTGVIQLDEAYWGGEHHGGKRGRGSPNKVPFIAAVATNEACHPIAMHADDTRGRFSDTDGRELGANTSGPLKHGHLGRAGLFSWLRQSGSCTSSHCHGRRGRQHASHRMGLDQHDDW